MVIGRKARTDRIWALVARQYPHACCPGGGNGWPCSSTEGMYGPRHMVNAGVNSTFTPASSRIDSILEIMAVPSPAPRTSGLTVSTGSSAVPLPSNLRHAAPAMVLPTNRTAVYMPLRSIAPSAKRAPRTIHSSISPPVRESGMAPYPLCSTHSAADKAARSSTRCASEYAGHAPEQAVPATAAPLISCNDSGIPLCRVPKGTAPAALTSANFRHSSAVDASLYHGSNLLETIKFDGSFKQP